MSEKQQQLAKIILQDPAVASLSSFIGADGTNTTLNSADVFHQPQTTQPTRPECGGCYPKTAEEPRPGARRDAVHAAGAEHHGRRPREPHPYQYTLEDPDINELNEWNGPLRRQAEAVTPTFHVATDQQTGASAVSLMIDRVTASRLGSSGHCGHALRRLRSAPDLLYPVHPAQPVSRDSRGVAAIPAGSIRN